MVVVVSRDLIAGRFARDMRLLIASRLPAVAWFAKRSRVLDRELEVRVCRARQDVVHLARLGRFVFAQAVLA